MPQIQTHPRRRETDAQLRRRLFWQDAAWLTWISCLIFGAPAVVYGPWWTGWALCVAFFGSIVVLCATIRPFDWRAE